MDLPAVAPHPVRGRGGGAIMVTCPARGGSSPDAARCEHCGADLRPAAAPPPARPPAGAGGPPLPQPPAGGGAAPPRGVRHRADLPPGLPAPLAPVGRLSVTTSAASSSRCSAFSRSPEASAGGLPAL